MQRGIAIVACCPGVRMGTNLCSTWGGDEQMICPGLGCLPPVLGVQEGVAPSHHGFQGYYNRKI